MNGIYEMIEQANYKMYRLWADEIVFSWRWWFNIALTVIPWIIWVKIRDKQKTTRLLFVGLVVIIITNCLNNIGLSLHFWHYNWKATPITLMFIPWDYTLFPVVIMLMLQTLPKIHPFIKALAFASVTSFILEPFYSWIGMYEPVHWKYWYSFLIYIPLYMLFHMIYTSKLLNPQKNQ